MSRAANRHDAAVRWADIAAYDAMEDGLSLVFQTEVWHRVYWAELCSPGVLMDWEDSHEGY